MRASLYVLVVAGCGRVGFAPGVDGNRTNDGDATSNAVAFRYPRVAVAAVINATNIDLAPVTVPTGVTFSITPALPNGVSLDATTGTISGVPTSSAEQTYTITATNGTVSASTTLDMIALPGSVVGFMSDTVVRAAISSANATAGKELVLLPPGTYPMATGFDVTDDLVIAGDSAATTFLHSATLHGAYKAIGVASANLTLWDLTIDDYGGTSAGGALQVTGGSLLVERSVFSNNATPGSGGVLFVNNGARATFHHCTFDGNSSNGGNGGGWGGVIDGEGANTTIVVTHSYATKNATNWGAFAHITTGTTLRLESSTLYDNTSRTAGTLASPGGTYTLVNVTMVGNSNTNSTADSAGLYLFAVPAHYTVTSSVIAGNRDINGFEHDCNRNDVGTSLTSGGGNIIGDDAWNCAAYFTAATDHLMTDPRIFPGGPGDHGGFTPTLLLDMASPALGNGGTACPPTDQRDFPRGTPCDSGAVEQ